MSDPDAPSPSNPTHREWLHWIVTNIPGGAPNIADGHQVESGRVLSSFPPSSNDAPNY